MATSLRLTPQVQVERQTVLIPSRREQASAEARTLELVEPLSRART